MSKGKQIRTTTTRLFCALFITAAPISCNSRTHTPVDVVSVTDSGVELAKSANTTSIVDWPAWRGPQTNGIAPGQGLPTRWDENSNVRWRSDVPGRGHSSPIVVGDSVYLATAIESEQKQCVLSYDRAGGGRRWTTVVHEGGFPSNREIHRKGTNANGTVACDGERIYVAFLNSDKIQATALDLDGNIVWQREVGAFDSKFGYAPSPILYQSFVVIAADNWGGGYLAALDGKTGDIAWRVARGDSSSYSSPTVAKIGDRDQLVISGCDAVTSYDPASGEQLWRTQCISDATCGTVITNGQLVFASGGYPDKETVCLSASGEKIWSNRTKIYEPSMVISGDHLFAVSDDGIAYCWEAETGELAWRQRLGGSFSASPLLSDQLIFAPNLNGETLVFKATPESYQEVAENKLGSDCYASPAAAEGALYLRIGVGAGGDRSEQLVCLTNQTTGS